MLLVILGFTLLLFLCGCFIFRHTEDGLTLALVGGVLSAFALVATVAVGVNVSELKTLDPKIAMYQEENEIIEKQLAVFVENYMEYEKETLKEFVPTPEGDIVLFLSMYPELKSDTFIEKQIEVYLSNRKQIKNLKEKKLDGTVLRWWLYFGK